MCRSAKKSHVYQLQTNRVGVNSKKAFSWELNEMSDLHIDVMCPHGGGVKGIKFQTFFGLDIA